MLWFSVVFMGVVRLAHTFTQLLSTKSKQTHLRSLTMLADVQFLFNPADDPGSGSRETATVLGLHAQIIF